jgi:hypothetical protein
MRSRALDKTCPALGNWLSSFKSNKRRTHRHLPVIADLNLLVEVLTARCHNMSQSVRTTCRHADLRKSQWQSRFVMYARRQAEIILGAARAVKMLELLLARGI